MTIPTVADELCRIAVITNPTKIAISGLVKEPSSETTSGDSLNEDIAPLIVLSPMNKIPKPKITTPIFFTFCLLQNINMTTPMITKQRCDIGKIKCDQLSCHRRADIGS